VGAALESFFGYDVGRNQGASQGPAGPGRGQWNLVCIEGQDRAFGAQRPRVTCSERFCETTNARRTCEAGRRARGDRSTAHSPQSSAYSCASRAVIQGCVSSTWSARRSNARVSRGKRVRTAREGERSRARAGKHKWCCAEKEKANKQRQCEGVTDREPTR
jgi:hypothetical protein